MKHAARHHVRLLAHLAFVGWREAARQQRARGQCGEPSPGWDLGPRSPPTTARHGDRSSYSPFSPVHATPLWSATRLDHSLEESEYVPFVEEDHDDAPDSSEPLWLRNACSLVLKQCHAPASSRKVHETVLGCLQDVVAHSQRTSHESNARRWALENVMLLRRESLGRTWLRRWHGAAVADLGSSSAL